MNDRNELSILNRAILDKTQTIPELRQSVKVAPPKYQAHITSDRPMYQPGETMYTRALVLDKASHLPVEANAHIRLLSPSKNEVFNTKNFAEKATSPGVTAAGFTLPSHLAQGIYTLEAFDPMESESRFASHRMEVLIQDTKPPLAYAENFLNKANYKPGDEVIVQGQIKDLSFGEKFSQPVTLSYSSGDEKIAPLIANTVSNEKGEFKAKLKLPEKTSIHPQLKLGIGNLTTQTIPLPMEPNVLQVECFPESGELLTGVQQRVYFKVTDEYGKPADLTARLIDHNDQPIADLKTINDPQSPASVRGVGIFEFTPLANTQYKLDMPKASLSKSLKSLDSHATMRQLESSDSTITHWEVNNSGKARTLVMTESCRGVMDVLTQLEFKSTGSKNVSLKYATEQGGVHRFTLWEKVGKELIPLAERLVYREMNDGLEFKMAVRNPLVAGRPFDLELSSQLNGKLVPSRATVAIPYKSLAYGFRDETMRSLPTHFTLSGEIENAESLENLDYYLNRTPEARKSLDLLLGTAGWRKFARVTDEVGQPVYSFGQEEKRFSTVTEIPQVIDNLSEAETLVEEQVKNLKDKELANLVSEKADLGRRKDAHLQELPVLRDNLKKHHESFLVESAELSRQIETIDDSWSQYRSIFTWASVGVFLLAVSGAGLSVLKQTGSLKAWLISGFSLTILGSLTWFGWSHFPGFQQELVHCKEQFKPAEIPELSVVQPPTGGIRAPGMMTSKDESDDKHTKDFSRGRITGESAVLPSPSTSPSASERREPLIVPNGNSVKNDPDSSGKELLKASEPSSKNPLAPTGFGGGAMGGMKAKDMTGNPAGKMDKGGSIADKPKKGFEGDEKKRDSPPAFEKTPNDSQAYVNQPRHFQGFDAVREKHQIAKEMAKAPLISGMTVSEQAHQITFVRVYGYQPPKSQVGGSDEPGTLYWNAMLDLKEGLAKLNLVMPHSGGNYLARIFGHDGQGHLGAKEMELSAQPLLTLNKQLRLPRYLHSGDELHIPVSLSDDFAGSRKVKLSIKGDGINLVGNTSMDLSAKTAFRVISPAVTAATIGRVKIQGENEKNESVSWVKSFELVPANTTKPMTSNRDIVNWEVSYKRGSVEVDEVVRVTALIRNRTAGKQGETRGEVELPAGLELSDPKALDELKKKNDRNRLDQWSIEENRLVLTWNNLQPEEVIEIPLDLIARNAGTFHASNSHAIVVNQGHRTYSSAIKISILPKK